MKAWFEAEGWEVRLTDIDPFYVHIDLMVVMLAPKLAAVCLESTDPDVVEWLKSKAIEIVSVPFQDTLDLGCNVVALGDDRILLPEKSLVLKEKARALGHRCDAGNTAGQGCRMELLYRRAAYDGESHVQ